MVRDLFTVAFIALVACGLYFISDILEALKDGFDSAWIATLMSNSSFVTASRAAGYAVGAYVVAKSAGYILGNAMTAPNSYICDDPTTVGDDFEVVGKRGDLGCTLEEVPQLFNEMKASFDSGLSRPIAKRREQLKALLAMFVENEDKIMDALRADLARPAGEGLYHDNLLPVTEIRHLIRDLEKHTRPQPVKNLSVLTWPSKQWLEKEPYGVALVIGTWNFPFLTSFNPVAGAIAAGNTVVLKPSMIVPTCAKLIGTLVNQYMDPRILQVAGQSAERDRYFIGSLIDQPFNSSFFTGSPSVGKIVAQGAAKHLAPITLELGGKNPVFVTKCADLALAAKQTVWGRNMNAGQQCISPEYVMCPRHLCGEFATLVKHQILAQHGTDPTKKGALGRIVGASQFKRISGLMDKTNGKAIHGGDYDADTKYIAPSVYIVDEDDALMSEEIFGPILLVLAYDDLDDAIRFVAKQPKSLTSYIFSKDDHAIRRILDNTSAGGVTVNGTVFHVGHAALPFGGVGDSGMGRYHGKYTIDCFQHEKPVLHKARWWDGGLLSDPFVLYPPWTDFKLKALRLVASLQ